MWRFLRPATPVPPLAEVARSALGAALGLVVTDLALWAMGGAGDRPLAQIALVAPFGATAYLVFSLPNSPLAQPWSALVGNAVSAAVALALLHLGLPLLPTVTLAVLLAIGAMALSRAMHPPGGAVAIATVLLAQSQGHAPGWGFLLHPILTGTAALVTVGMIWNPLTGRQYPLPPPSTSPSQRQTPGPMALGQALDRLRLGANLGVEDLSRLIAAADSITAAQNLGPMTAQRVMSRDPVTLSPEDSLQTAADIFRRTGYRHLPLVERGEFAGLVPQTALLGPLPDTTLFALSESVHTMPPDTPLADLLTLMATGRQICIPVTDEGRLLGLITRTDLLAAMTRGPLPA
jgi:CBS domain-containing membrane protein